MDTLTQYQKILRSFKKNTRQGLTTYELITICPAEYRARISELRRDGYNIVDERVYSNNKYMGYFRYFLIEENEMADVA